MQDLEKWVDDCRKLYSVGKPPVEELAVRLEYSSVTSKWDASVSEVYVYAPTQPEAMKALTKALYTRAVEKVRNAERYAAFGGELLRRVESENHNG